MRISKVLFLSIFAFLILMSCEETATDDAGSLELNAVVEEQAAFGWQMSRSATVTYLKSEAPDPGNW